MDYDTFKLIHSELIMSMQYIEQDLKINYSHISGDKSSFGMISEYSLGQVLTEYAKLEKKTGKHFFSDQQYQLMHEIREIRNYWCHQCYLDFHYVEGREEHEKAFQEVANRLHYDELRVFELQQGIEQLRKSIH